MQIEQLVRYLDEINESRDWLSQLGVQNIARAHRNLHNMVAAGMTLDLMSVLCEQLSQILPPASDPDMALNNLERFVLASRSPLSVGSLFERDADALPTLVRIFSSSQYLADLLIRDPESFDLLRMTEGKPIARRVIVDEIANESRLIEKPDEFMALIRQFKRRETLRIAYGDLIRSQNIDVVTKQISYLAEAICEATIAFARRQLEQKRGVPRRLGGEPASFVCLAVGKLGGEELNYSSDIDLMFVFDGQGDTDGERAITNREFFERLVKDVVRLLSEATDLGIAYRVDLRLRPNGPQGPPISDLNSALYYYDVSARTWERQALIKVRAIAGDLDLGSEFLDRLEPWIYRRYLNRADITGIKALKRRIEKRAKSKGNQHNVKTGNGGIQDIEFVIQFLQLLNGCDLPRVRTGNTLSAIQSLEQEGCLTFQERSYLEQNYAMLRKIEHRLQIMFDLQTHELPADDVELRKVAMRMGFDDEGGTALEDFRSEWMEATRVNRQILDHLLHDAFPDDPDCDPELDLILDPHPSEESIERILQPYGFQDVPAAYQNLLDLSVERIPFLSTRRCRHFLASIASNLLSAIAETPDPDLTLVNLCQVSDSLGGKGVLWELFSFNAPSLELYVRLCATSPYLAGILTTNPGMIDELLDSLLLDKLPSVETLQDILADLCRAAEDVDPILHSFKNSFHLRVGVRDILGKAAIQQTHRALADIAEVCLKQIANQQFERLVQKYGQPQFERNGDIHPCEFVILAMGKLGGQEPNYQSDVDLIFLYQQDGKTQPVGRSQVNTTSNQHFFSELGQRIMKVVNQLGPQGRLFEVDPRVRPTGKSGVLTVALSEFARYFRSGQAELWERQSLCKARTLYGSELAQEETMHLCRQLLKEHPWQSADARAIYGMRKEMEETASDRNLKRGPGGTVDIEFIVQMLQMKHASDNSSMLDPNTLTAIEQLKQAQALTTADADELSSAYQYLRSVESRLRLLNTTARHDLPEDSRELAGLAYLLNCSSSQHLVKSCRQITARNRQMFEARFATEMNGG